MDLIFNFPGNIQFLTIEKNFLLHLHCMAGYTDRYVTPLREFQQATPRPFSAERISIQEPNMLQQTTFTAAFVSLIVSVSTALFGYTAENGNANGVQETNESSPLISAAQLHELLGSEGSENIVVIDLGPERETFDKAHIKGAQFVDWVKDITDMDQPNLYKLVDQAGMQKLLRRLGITEQSKICLLYTSPSPRDLSTSRMPSSA